jgi:hypothetical protein
MDDLYLATFRRRAEQGLVLQQRALQSHQPLWALWEMSRDPRGTVLTMEFAALANHRPAIRDEIAAVAERLRAQQVEVLADVLDRHGITVDECPPVVAAVLIAGISVLLALEQGSLGMSAGHAETITYVEEFLRRLEGERSND